MNIAVEEHWHNLLRAMGREELRDDPRFVDNAARVANREATDSPRAWHDPLAFAHGRAASLIFAVL
jgi:hypothetical protein